MTTINNTNFDKLQEFIFEFNNRLETFGVEKKFIEDVKSLGLKDGINLENLKSYSNESEWNKYLDLIDSYYPALLDKYFSKSIPMENYAIPKFEQKVTDSKKLSFEELFNASERRVQYLLERKKELETEIIALKKRISDFEN